MRPRRRWDSRSGADRASTARMRSTGLRSASPRACSGRWERRPASVALTLASWKPASRPGLAFTRLSTAACGSRADRLVAAAERLDEAPDLVGVVDDRALAGDHDELVVRRHADLIHPDHVGVLVHPLKLDRLVVPVRAEGRVDPSGEHRRDEVGADVDLLDRARSARARATGSWSGRRAGRGSRRRRRACREDQRRVRMCLEPIETIEVSGSWTIAATDTSGSPLSRASMTSGS